MIVCIQPQNVPDWNELVCDIFPFVALLDWKQRDCCWMATQNPEQFSLWALIIKPIQWS